MLARCAVSDCPTQFFVCHCCVHAAVGERLCFSTTVLCSTLVSMHPSAVVPRHRFSRASVQCISCELHPSMLPFRLRFVYVVLTCLFSAVLARSAQSQNLAYSVSGFSARQRTHYLTVCPQFHLRFSLVDEVVATDGYSYFCVVEGRRGGAVAGREANLKADGCRIFSLSKILSFFWSA